MNGTTKNVLTLHISNSKDGKSVGMLCEKQNVT